jgi:hypothetical protein
MVVCLGLFQKSVVGTSVAPKEHIRLVIISTAILPGVSSYLLASIIGQPIAYWQKLSLFFEGKTGTIVSASVAGKRWIF